MPWPLLLLPVLSTLAGGLLVMRLGHHLAAAMTVAAGMLFATALVNLTPEAAEQIGAVYTGIVMLAGLSLYLLTETLLERGSGHIHDGATHVHRPVRRLGLLGSLGLLLHSLLDGVVIGAGFAASPELGLLVLLAVVAHDFADGLNLVTIALASGAGRRGATVLLVADALAVPAGAALGTAVAIAPPLLAVLLALFAGVFLAIGAGHLLPEARADGVRPSRIAAGVVAGSSLVVVIRMLGGH
jgi:ZIP family zinc transporter